MAMKTICCICQRCKRGEQWVPGGGNLVADTSHGYCPDCFALVEQELNLRKAAVGAGKKIRRP